MNNLLLSSQYFDRVYLLQNVSSGSITAFKQLMEQEKLASVVSVTEQRSVLKEFFLEFWKKKAINTEQHPCYSCF